MIEIRESKFSDIPVLMEMYREARQIQLDSGNLHQWRDGYPTEDIIRQDIALGVSFVIEENGKLKGAFSFIPGDDPTYRQIEKGAWIDDVQPYATIHRLGRFKAANGIARICFDWCWDRIHNLRIDTHEDNAIMRHCIEKYGFKYCGVIHLLNGDPRIAFQKIDL